MGIVGTQVKFAIETIREALRKTPQDNPCPKNCGEQATFAKEAIQEELKRRRERKAG